MVLKPYISPITATLGCWVACNFSPASIAETRRFEEVTQILDLEPSQSDATSQLSQSIEQLVQYALSQHPALAAETYQTTSREISVREARAAYQPEITVSAGISRQNSLASDIPGESRAQSERESVSLRQNLWRGGKDSTQIAIAQTDAQIAQLSTESKSQEIALTVRQASLRFNQAALSEAFANQAAKDAEEITKLSERKFSAGQAGKIDVHQASLRESEARAQAAKASMNTNEAYFALLSSLGLRSAAPQELKGALDTLRSTILPLPKSPAVSPADAPQPSPLLSVKSSELTADRAHLTQSLARRERWLPALDFVASWSRDLTTGRVDPGVVQIGGTRDRDALRLRTNFGLELNWTLWNGIRDERINRAAADEAVARARATDAEYAANIARETLTQQIKDLYKIIPSYKAAYQAAVRLYDAQRKLYDAGATNVFAVTDADTRRLSALREWLDAAYQIKIAILKWEALGKGYLARN